MKYTTPFLLVIIASLSLAQVNNNLQQCVNDAQHIGDDLQQLKTYIEQKKIIKAIVVIDDISETFKDAQNVCGSITLPDILQFLDEHLSDQAKTCIAEVAIIGLGVRQMVIEAKAGHWDEALESLLPLINMVNQAKEDCSGIIQKIEKL